MPVPFFRGALAIGLVATAPVAAAAVGIAGAVMVGIEMYEAFDNLERGKEGKGPAFGSIHPNGD